MRRSLWGTIYSLIGAGAVSCIALIIRSIQTNSDPIGMAGMALGMGALFSTRLVQDAHWLKDARAKVEADREEVHRGQLSIQAKAALIENDIHRATRELEADQMEGRAQLEAEREEMLAEVEAKKNEYKTEGFQVGVELGRRGLAAETNIGTAKVIRLPIGQDRSTTMDDGAVNN